MKISLVVFEIANPSNGVRGRVGPPLRPGNKARSSWVPKIVDTIQTIDSCR